MARFATAYSDKLIEEDAVKEVSLKIKRLLPRSIGLTFVFFTSPYRPTIIQRIMSVTLTPENFVGIEVPALIYEGKISERGIVVVCISAGSVGSEVSFIKEDKPEEIEIVIRRAIQKLKTFSFSLGFLAPSINPYNYLAGTKFGLGKNANIVTAGFEPRRSEHAQIFNTNIGAGVLYVWMTQGALLHWEKVSGFFPVGRPFTFTKVDVKRKVILEIDNHPAAGIYKRYLEEKFEIFKKKKFFYIFPLGVKAEKTHRLLNIVNILEDDSLHYIGELKEGEEGTLMVINEEALKEDTERIVNSIKTKMNPRLVIVVSSLLRRQLLKNESAVELALIKELMGQETEVVGFYTDYQVVFDKTIKEFIIEKGNLYLISLE